MASRLFLLLAAAWMGWASGQTTDYCKFTPEHTVCKHSGRGARCGPRIRGSGVSPEDAAVIVALHNELRSKVARGEETRGAPGPQPSAANMRALAWDEELAMVAQRHADQCVFEHECSDCRRVDRFGVGQNLFISFQSNLDLRVQWNRAILSWYNEVELFPNSSVQPYQFSQATGHYTQMLWWDTSLIGCGFTMFLEDGWWKKLYTCNYGPAGNIIFTQMYLGGAPCSSCPASTSCSLEYPGLCERDDASDLSTNTSTTILPPTPNEGDINTILQDFNGFSGLININSITPNNMDLQALVEFFNNLRRNTLITASPTTTPVPGPTSTASPTTPSAVATTPAFTDDGADSDAASTEPDAVTTSTSDPSAPLSVTPKGPSSTSSSAITSPVQSEAITNTFTDELDALLSEFTTLVPSASPSSLEPDAEQITQVPEMMNSSDTHMDSRQGNQEKLTLMSILMRAGKNTQVIRTSSLNEVHDIIQGLGENVEPIVVFRSVTGELTELDPKSLTPVPIRAHRSASNRVSSPARLLTCDMELSPCTMSVVGGNWSIARSPGEGHHVEIHVAEDEGTEVVIKKVVQAPSSGVACVAFTHRRDMMPTNPNTTTAAAATSTPQHNTLPELQVGVMPLGRQTAHKSVLGVPGKWEMSRSTFRDLNTQFVVMVSMGAASTPAILALDALMVTDGPCCLSGRC